MNDKIQKLVQLDKECSLKVEEAKLLLNQVDDNHLMKQKEINDQYLKENNTSLLRQKKEIEQLNEEEIIKLNEEYNAQVELLNTTFNKNKKQYIKDLTQRCLK